MSISITIVSRMVDFDIILRVREVHILMAVSVTIPSIVAGISRSLLVGMYVESIVVVSWRVAVGMIYFHSHASRSMSIMPMAMVCCPLAWMMNINVIVRMRSRNILMTVTIAIVSGLRRPFLMRVDVEPVVVVSRCVAVRVVNLHSNTCRAMSMMPMVWSWLC